MDGYTNTGRRLFVFLRLQFNEFLKTTTLRTTYIQTSFDKQNTKSLS